MSATLKDKQMHNAMCRAMGWKEKYYKMVDEVYKDQDGNIVNITAVCGCKGKKICIDIAEVEIGDICDTCNKPYRHTQVREYL